MCAGGSTPSPALLGDKTLSVQASFVNYIAETAEANKQVFVVTCSNNILVVTAMRTPNKPTRHMMQTFPSATVVVMIVYLPQVVAYLRSVARPEPVDLMALTI